MLAKAMPRPRKIRPPLTQRAIDAAKLGRKDRFLWDGIEHGLGVKVTPAGSKIFILQKAIHGRLRRITLGPYGDSTLDAARRQARRLNGEIAQGRDPIADAKAQREERDRRQRTEKTVSDLWERYWLEIVSPYNRPRTATEKRYLWKSRIEPNIGSLKAKDVTDQDIGAIIRGALVCDKSGNIVSGRGAAGNLYRLCHHMFAKALLWGMRPRELGNPLEGVAEPRVSRRRRLLTNREVGALLKMIDEAAAKGTENEVALAAIKTVIHTGARISEILRLQWKEVRQQEREVHLADTKTGFSRRPISEEALAAISAVERLPGCPYVFRSPRKPTLPMEYTLVRKVFQRIALQSGVANCTLHTVRHWFSTVTANNVSNHRVGMALTGHKSHAAYMTYVHEEREQARALADQIGAFTRSLGENVVSLKKATSP
jgi:integrase